jgi:hypothetical protein
MKKLFLLFLIGIFILTGCKSISQNDPLQRLVEQGKQNLSVQKPSNNTQNPPQTNVPEVSVVSPESQDVLPVTKTFTDKYSDIYVITVEKFEKNLKVTNEWLKPQEGETIVGVFVKVKNNGNHFKWVLGVECSLKDFTSYAYSVNFLSIVNHKAFEGVNLGPGKECEGWIFFKVPKTVLDLQFTLIYDTGEYDEHFNNKTLQFKLN